MIRFVIDASVMGPLLFQDEADASLAMLPGALAEAACIVPSHWRLEVANQLISGVRRKRATSAEAVCTLADLDELPVHIDSLTADQCWSRTYALAERHGLTIYDAAYLELAERLKLPLVSFDADLVKAARADAIEAMSRP
ncbi:MAG: type II toxin-antitoxin system VapC family toxin [Sphingomonadaceae bacterium]